MCLPCSALLKGNLPYEASAVGTSIEPKHPRSFSRAFRFVSASLSRSAVHRRYSVCRQMVQQLEGWADEFGGDYELSLFGKRMVVLTRPAECRRVLSLRPAKFGRGLTPVNPSSFFFFFVGWLYGRYVCVPLAGRVP